MFYLGWKRFQKLDCLPKIGHLRHRIWRNGEALGGFCKSFGVIQNIQHWWKTVVVNLQRAMKISFCGNLMKLGIISFKALHGPFAEVLLCLLHALQHEFCPWQGHLYWTLHPKDWPFQTKATWHHSIGLTALTAFTPFEPQDSGDVFRLAIHNSDVAFWRRSLSLALCFFEGFLRFCYQLLGIIGVVLIQDPLLFCCWEVSLSSCKVLFSNSGFLGMAEEWIHLLTFWPIRIVIKFQHISTA